MSILIFIGMLLAGSLLVLVKKTSAVLIYNIAEGYLMLALAMAAGTWISFFAGTKYPALVSILSFLLRWGSFLGNIILAYLVTNVLLALRTDDLFPEEYSLEKINRVALWGISVLTCNTFLVFTAGKLTHLPEMISFFRQSGYAIWFLYFIMAIECLGTLGVLLHTKLNTGIWAAIGLMLIMLGAVYTHWHNKDPFSDSYTAIGQLINLSILLLLYYSEKRIRNKAFYSSIYVI